MAVALAASLQHSVQADEALGAGSAPRRTGPMLSATAKTSVVASRSFRFMRTASFPRKDEGVRASGEGDTRSAVGVQERLARHTTSRRCKEPGEAGYRPPTRPVRRPHD